MLLLVEVVVDQAVVDEVDEEGNEVDDEVDEEAIKAYILKASLMTPAIPQKELNFP